jgi:hypothetical protein
MGRVKSEAEYKALRDTIGHPDDDVGDLDVMSCQYFRDKMESIFDFLKAAKPKKDPELQRLKQIRKQKRWGRITKRVQRYLGLRAQAAYAHLLGKRVMESSAEAC